MKKKLNRHFVPRLYVEHPLSLHAAVRLNEEQSHYLLKVMRLARGDSIFLFNGVAGEWSGTIDDGAPREVVITLTEKTREQTAPVDVLLLFSPLRSQRTAWIGQKAAELGVKGIAPVLTQHSIAREVNSKRVRANIIEGAEQSESLFLPKLYPLKPLAVVLEQLEPDRLLIFCDETLAAPAAAAPSASPAAALTALRQHKRFAILIGAEGGFAPHERQAIYDLPLTQPLWLGPRIMRAETAMLAALALFQACLGDWR